MQKLLTVLVALVALEGVALAGKTQADASDYKAAGKTGHVYGRSDGLYQAETTHSPYMIENGTSAGPVGKGFYLDFT